MALCTSLERAGQAIDWTHVSAQRAARPRCAVDHRPHADVNKDPGVVKEMLQRKIRPPRPLSPSTLRLPTCVTSSATPTAYLCPRGTSLLDAAGVKTWKQESTEHSESSSGLCPMSSPGPAVEGVIP